MQEIINKEYKCINKFFEIFGNDIPEAIHKNKDDGKAIDIIIYKLKKNVNEHLVQNWIFDEKIYIDISFYNNNLTFYVYEVARKRPYRP